MQSLTLYFMVCYGISYFLLLLLLTPQSCVRYNTSWLNFLGFLCFLALANLDLAKLEWADYAVQA